MSAKLANIIWMSVVRSILEYGCEVWGDRSLEDFESLQVEMGKRILRCSSRTNSAVVRGELGWETVKARRDEMRLRYWAKLTKMGPERMARKVYDLGRTKLLSSLERGEAPEPGWCVYTRSLLIELGLEEVWSSGVVPASWLGTVREKIHEREEKAWRQEVEESSKLRTYRHLHEVLEPAPYLECYYRLGLIELVKLRGGTNRLRIEQGRYYGLEASQRTCQVCSSSTVEDESHFVLDCPAYEILRSEMWVSLTPLTGKSRAAYEGQEKITTLAELIGDIASKGATRVVMKFIVRAMGVRKKILREKGLLWERK